ncbi:HRDC-like protein [Pelagophyceae sp. CCMP2097]|nr:HRDC-like protein [Pelagophyceae sp. CCMP2097]|eukprot:CAMPEP_0184093932 /NCGR_PEP_ID=MMETSP0974-20121125/9005_1 /TAXON_ID=483370 /ORGANISM="non described non described, Strain CCMP2097" /LENGTH=142 /DNA_ID=CAMNT_0026396711 /DNA_START=46 /DNA_END=474 /DNA_ORIENTATION=-
MNVEDEDASELRFGPEFPDDPECLSDKEVASFLHQRAQGNTREMKPHLRKAYDYARRSVGSKDMASVTDSAVSLRQALSELEFSAADGTVVQKLQRFEIASLANLMNKDSEPDEAKALLHSLHRFNDEQLTEMLDVISRNEI